MQRKPNSKRAATRPVRCEEVRFAEVEFPQPVKPRMVVRFSDGLSQRTGTRSITVRILIPDGEAGREKELEPHRGCGL